MRTAFLLKGPFRHALLTAFYCFLIACEKINTDGLTNLNGNSITVLGHRGNGVNGMYPDNSMESMEAGIDELGADGVEMDIQISKDGELMLFHNEELGSITSCSGKINSRQKNELAECLYDASVFNAPLHDYHLATLDAVFNRFKSYTPLPVFFLDTKQIYEEENYPDSANHFNVVFGNTIHGLISKYNLEQVVLVNSGSKELLAYMKNNFPSLKLLLHADNFEDGLNTAQFLGLFGITIHYSYVTRAQIETAHAAGIRIALWGVGSVSSCRETVRLFPDYVKTDNISYMLSLLN